MELISKYALEAKLMLCMDMNRADWSYNKMIMANKMLEILDQEPIIEERKHGRWEGGGAYYCSNCNAYAATDTHRDFLDVSEQHYCYNCGAIMDGDEE